MFGYTARVTCHSQKYFCHAHKSTILVADDAQSGGVGRTGTIYFVEEEALKLSGVV